MNKIPNPLLRQFFFILIITGLSVLLFWNLRFFVSAVLGAYTLFVLLSQPMALLTERWKWRRTLAVVTVMVGSFLIVFVPLFWFFRLLNVKLLDAITYSPVLLEKFQTLINDLEQRTGMKILTTGNIQDIANWVITEARQLLQATLSGLGTIAATYFILYFMLQKGRHMGDQFFNWLPLKQHNLNYVKKQLNSLVYSNAVGIPLMGIVQGIAALIAFLIAGVEAPLFWFALTCITGIMPFIGVSLTFIPLTLVLFAHGMPVKAGLLLLYGLIVVGSVDNLARMWLLQKIGNTHPLVTVSGVICGLKLFGFIGFIFGPILVSFFLLLIHLYTKEFGEPESAETDE